MEEQGKLCNDVTTVDPTSQAITNTYPTKPNAPLRPDCTSLVQVVSTRHTYTLKHDLTDANLNWRSLYIRTYRPYIPAFAESWCSFRSSFGPRDPFLSRKKPPITLSPHHICVQSSLR